MSLDNSWPVGEDKTGQLSLCLSSWNILWPNLLAWFKKAFQLVRPPLGECDGWNNQGAISPLLRTKLLICLLGTYLVLHWSLITNLVWKKTKHKWNQLTWLFTLGKKHKKRKEWEVAGLINMCFLSASC